MEHGVSREELKEMLQEDNVKAGSIETILEALYGADIAPEIEEVKMFDGNEKEER